MTAEERYYDVDVTTKDQIEKVFKQMSFPIGVSFDYIGDRNLKFPIKIKKVPGDFAFRTGKEILATVNEEMFDLIDELSLLILIEQELGRIQISIDTGKIQLLKHDIPTFSGILQKHGQDAIIKANHLVGITADQLADVKKSSPGEKDIDKFF